MITEEKANLILALFKNMDVESRLKAIQQAQLMYKDMFTDDMQAKDYAYSAYVVESFYNYLREILRVYQVRVAPRSDTPDKVEKVKKKKKTTSGIDLNALMAGFLTDIKGKKE